MKQWDIYLFRFAKEEPHPVVIVSSDERCEHSDAVNGLICTTVRLTRPPKRHETLLDEADGLDWKTACRCDFMYGLPKAEFGAQRGRVSEIRRRDICAKLRECFRLVG